MSFYVKPELLQETVHFPAIRFKRLPQQKGFFTRLFNFLTLKREFEFLEEFCLWCPYLGRFVYFPKGFVADGASVPKLLHSVYGSYGVLFYGSLPHDFGHQYHGLFCVRSDTNKVFFEILSKEDLDVIFEDVNLLETDKKKAVYAAKKTLDWFSGRAWEKNRRKNRSVVEDFPEICKTTGTSDTADTS